MHESKQNRLTDIKESYTSTFTPGELMALENQMQNDIQPPTSR